MMRFNSNRYLLSILAISGCCFFTHSATSQKPTSEHPRTEGNGEYRVGPDFHIDPDLTDCGSPTDKRSNKRPGLPIML